MFIRLGKVNIHITFAFALFFAFACGTAAGEKTAAALVSALCHECVHLVFLIGFGCTDIRLTLRPGGAAVKCAGLEFIGVKKQLVALLSAPLSNLAAGAALFFLAAALKTPELKNAALVNVCLGGVNLLPIPFLDGGRALNAALCVKYNESTVTRKTEAAGTASLFLLALLTLILSLTGKNPVGAAVFTGYCVVFSLIGKSRKRE